MIAASSDPAFRSQAPSEPSTADDSDAMDVDISLVVPDDNNGRVSPMQYPISAAPTVTNFSNLFFDSASPSVLPRPLKRRSVSPEASPKHNVVQSQRHSHEADFSPFAPEHSSSPAPPSPSARKFDRFASTGALFKNISRPTLPAFASNATNDNKRARRPTISAIISNEGQGKPLQSAYPIMEKEDEKENFGLKPAPRRAFSAVIQPPSSDEGDSYDHSVENSSPAAQAFAKRQAMKTLRRRDGTDDFRPLTALRQHDVSVKAPSPLRHEATLSGVHESPSTRWFNTGLPGFGDNEAHGKVLPCERVKVDGLMRINCNTVRFNSLGSLPVSES